MLVERGHEVINVTRGTSQPYLANAAWNSVQSVQADRDAEDKAGTFGQRIRDLKPDIVVDLICFSEDSARQLVTALKGEVQHFLHCGTIWIYGHSMQVPAREDQPRKPFGNYGIQKAAIEAYLLGEAHRSGFPATLLHAGHIVGPGYAPLGPAGNFDPQAFVTLARGEKLALPHFGMETVHHVHAVDVAQAFLKSITHWSASVGESFHAVSPAAITIRGYAEAVSGWFGHEANLEFLSWEEWSKTVPEKDATTTWEHISRSPNASIDKARRLIGYEPRYSSLEAIRESLDWLIEHKVITI